MKQLIRAALACAFSCLFNAAPAVAQTPLPASAYGELPALSDVAISADGTRIVTAGRRDGRDIIVVYDLATNQPIYAGNVDSDTELRGVGWAGDNIVSYSSTATLRPNQVLPANYYFRGAPKRILLARDSVIDLQTRAVRALSVGGEYDWADTSSHLIAPIDGDPGFGRLVGRAQVLEAHRAVVYRVNLASGDARPMTVRFGLNTLAYRFNAAGAPVARIDADPQTNHWTISVYDSDGMDHVIADGQNETGVPPDVLGLLPDGRLAGFFTNDDGVALLCGVDLATGETKPVLTAEGYEISDAIVDPWTRIVVGATWTEIEDRQEFFDADLQSAYESLKTVFPAGGARLVSWSRNRSRLVVYAENGLDGGAYYVLSRPENQIRRIGFRYPAIAAAPSATRQSISYRARDNTRVPAYLTLPAGVEPHNLPMVVLVHGGPASRDDMNFDFWSAFLASRGYAVLQPNYRGSSGYGEDWENAGHGQWGGLMQTDVEDGVNALARSGIADPARVCIVGASYGGYAALAGATLTPDRYKCAVAVAGVSDLIGFIRGRERTEGRSSFSADYWRISIGDRREDEQTLRDHSPANLADRVHIPILIMHGTDDTVVPIEQSRLMVSRLRAAHKDVRFVELRGDDHWLSRADTRTQMLSEIETFLAENLGAQ